MGWFDSVLGAEARKFIKRKDSDAAEAGKALEELRSALYNELRTTEGAKRQQQRFCGPVVAMSFNFVVAVLALAVVSAGVAVATVTDLEFNIFGACIAIAWIIPSAINKILWSNLQQQANWTALALMWKTTPITIFFLVALMPWLDPPGVLLFHWDLNNSTAVLISALLGFLLQWSGALALGATSATSHVVLGQFKTCVILVGGYLLFESDPGIVSLCGALAALAGMSVYTSLNLNLSNESASKQLPTQNPPPKSKTTQDVDDVTVAQDSTILNRNLV
ncbi:hypothetical protein COLO4_07737 [Corchorus olitorius]|uniref:Sugar phosphate transporter domain-containing protein n=1 Tax=Corchorus olitorius TaxID=93759 RepID=A0A1R3KIM1_9ROSI|nr:hypothetical protein COLO4_07737 [Corchorus olitorius]